VTEVSDFADGTTKSDLATAGGTVWLTFNGVILIELFVRGGMLLVFISSVALLALLSSTIQDRFAIALKLREYPFNCELIFC